MNIQSTSLPVWATREYAIYCCKDGERPCRVTAQQQAAMCDVCGAWTNMFVPKDDLIIRD